MKKLATIAILGAALAVVAISQSACVSAGVGSTRVWAGITTNGIGYRETVVQTNGVTNSTGFRITLPVNVGGAVQAMFQEAF